MDYVYEAVKLPTCPQMKLDTTASNPKEAAYQHRC
jgi:hypothetical protein